MNLVYPGYEELHKLHLLAIEEYKKVNLRFTCFSREKEVVLVYIYSVSSKTGIINKVKEFECHPWQSFDLLLEYVWNNY